jgi:hypothetical protein
MRLALKVPPPAGTDCVDGDPEYVHTGTGTPDPGCVSVSGVLPPSPEMVRWPVRDAAEVFGATE